MCLISSFFFSIKIILKQKRKTESPDNILFYLWKYLWKILASDILDRIQMNRLISKLESIFFSFVSQNNKYKYRKICYVFDIKFKLDPCISNYLELFQELVKENWWIISSREREDINNLPSDFQKNDKEYFKKTLSKLFKSSLWVIGKKREETSTSTFTRFKFFSSMKKFITFPILSRALSFSIISTPNNPYKFLQIKRFVHLEMNHYNPSLKIRKVLYKLVSIDVSILQSTFFLFFFLQRCTFQKESLIALQKLYCTSPRENLGYYTPFLCESLFNSLKDSSFLYFLCRTMLRIHLYLHIISFRIKLEFLAILKLG